MINYSLPTMMEVVEKDPLAFDEDEKLELPSDSNSVHPNPKLMSMSNFHEEILDSISESTEQNDFNKADANLNDFTSMQSINPQLFMETVKKLNPDVFLQTVQKILNTTSNGDVEEPKNTFISKDSSDSKVQKCSRQFCPKCTIEIKKSGQIKCPRCQVSCIYECLVCEKICENYQRLFQHLRTKCVPKNIYQCPYCSYLTPINYRLAKHMKRHEAVKTDSIFECEICGRVFQYQGSLNKHVESCKERDIGSGHELEMKEDDSGGDGETYKDFNDECDAIYLSDTNQSLSKNSKESTPALDKLMYHRSNKAKKEKLDKSIRAISNKNQSEVSKISAPTLVNNAGASTRKRGRKNAPEKIVASNVGQATEISAAGKPSPSTTEAEKFTDITDEELNYRRKRHKIYIDEKEEKDTGITSSSFTVVQINEYSDKTYLANMINQYCPRCDTTDENDVNIKLYQQLQLCKKCQQPNLLQCLKCKKRYDRYAAMHYHMMSTCNPQKYYKCSKCDYTVTVKSSMVKHYRNRHVVDENVYICPKCSTNFKTKVALASHLRFCKKDMKLQCKLCDFKTIYHWSMRNHMKKVHHQDPGEIVTTKGTVVRSFDLSNKDKQPLNVVECYCLKCEQRIEKCETCPNCNRPTLFKCTICRDEFTDAKNIKIHMYCKFKPVSQILSKKKSYHQCVFCKKKYTIHRTYQNHIKQCNKEPRYFCAHCSYKSLYKFNLKRHLDFTHNLGSDEKPEKDDEHNRSDGKSNVAIIREISNQTGNAAINCDSSNNWAWNYSGNNYYNPG